MVRDGTQYEVDLPFERLPRLCELLESTQGRARVTATFSQRKDHIVVSGRLQTDYPLQCQRCLAPMFVSIDERYELVFVKDEATAKALPKEFDPIILDDTGMIHQTDLLEDEMILHVPAIPKHSDFAGCVSGDREFGTPLTDADEAQKPRPFDVLGKLELQ
ncbi:MAG: YceD family protein [Granulosicoccus sp.]